ncbi:MAG: propionate catabolism operon regulatory protein PrpR [Candidatus Dactylopiibacterium sp.]|nr:propionate catabolism operon regulatory protein PrpR [Candidatus Dactylopiibacterium sp.]
MSETSFPPPAVSPPVRVHVFAFDRLASLIESVAADYANEAELVVERRRFADAVAHARLLVARGEADAFISAGANGAQLRRQLDRPVALVSVSGFDIMAALVKAARTSRRVGIVTYDFIADELKELSPLLTLPVALRRYVGERDVVEQVDSLRAEGVDTVIGPSMVVETAVRLGLRGVLIYSAESARAAIEEAIAAARVTQAAQARRRELAALLGTLREGVLAVDADARIWHANPAMAELLGRPAGALEGRALAEVLPEASLQALAAGAAPLRQVFLVAGRRMAGSLVPLEAEGRRAGAVLTLQDAGSVERAGRALRLHARGTQTATRHTVDDLVGGSAAIEQLRALARQFARIDLSVLIAGESGTGKELLAQGMHAASPRAGEPFVAINCAALPESLLESELFGYEEGAFTGAARGGRAGLFELAHRGTIFLDEIGDMPLALQARLLRVLQEREVWRVGGREPTPVDVRLIAATHRNLPACVLAGEFREDLYYRLNGLSLRIPPLRERLADLPGLVDALLGQIARRLGLPPPSPAWLARFMGRAMEHAWPGNVRELENLLERLVALASLPDAAEDLFAQLFPELSAAAGAAPPATLPARRAGFERDTLRQALAHAGGNASAAARALGISRTTFWRRMRGG